MSFHVYSNLLRHFRRNSVDISRCLVELNFFKAARCFSSYVESPAFTRGEEQKRFNKPFFMRSNSGKDLVPNGDPDVFGSLSNDVKFKEKFESLPEEEGDVVRKTFVDGRGGRTKLTTKQYADLIKNHLANKRLLEAIDILEVKMLQEDRMKPENYIYNLLIDGCAKVGYTKMAFKLYNDMKKRALKVTGATYTSLFNACALSPVHGDGLKRAHHLRELIIEKQVLLNRSNYHSMMKAFGRCGDLVTVFNIVDEMISEKKPLKPDTFCFLLQACVTDKKDGFRHAMMVWQKMRERGVKPTIFCFNLILRCARDCHLGDTLLLTQDLKLITAGDEYGEDQRLLNDGRREETSLERLGQVSDLPASVVLPNLLAVKPQLGSVVTINQIVKPKHRLMLMGGCRGFLEQMKRDDVKPDVKTATLLLDLIPSTQQAEHMLIKSFENSNIPLDIDFYNMLIKKRCMRHDYTASKEVLSLITKSKLLPNIVTFGVLSLSCRTTKDTVQFLTDLKDAGFRPNMEILGGLVTAARHSWNPEVIMMIMDIVLQEELTVSEIFLKHLEAYKDYTAKQLDLKKQGMKYHEKMDNMSYLKTYDRFLVKYPKWLKYIDEEDRDKIHPWTQYRKKSCVNNP